MMTLRRFVRPMPSLTNLRPLASLPVVHRAFAAPLCREMPIFTPIHARAFFQSSQPCNSGAASVDAPVSSTSDGLARVRASLTASSQTAVMFYDSLCPLCAFEIGHLRKLKAASRISWVDVSAPAPVMAIGTAPPTRLDLVMFGKSQDELLSAMHVYDVASGQWHIGTDAVRELYRQLGLGWLWRWTKHPAVRSTVDSAYEWFAENRHKLVPRRSRKHDE